MSNNEEAKIIVYGNYIKEQHIKTQNNYYGEEKKVGSNASTSDPLSAKSVEPYIRAGLLTPDLMPAQGLTSGEVAMLAHDIATRLKMNKYWPFFAEKWGKTCNSSTYSKFTKNPTAIDFQKRLNKI